MNYPKEFFLVNLRFALKISEITQESIERTLLHYTNLYIRFGLGRDFDAANPIWQEYLEGFHQSEDRVGWTHDFYYKRQQQVTAKLQESPFGCFSYTILEGNQIRLHFHNNDSSGHSPLHKSKMSKRMAELSNMFAHIKQKEIDSTNVIGASWLYNVEAYHRLFPPGYLGTAQVSEDDFAYLPLWGQFVDHRGWAKEILVTQFLECLEKQQKFDEVIKCFPFPVLRLESSIQEFYQFYDVGVWGR